MINTMKQNKNKLVIALMVFLLVIVSIYIGLNAVDLGSVKTDKDLWSLTQNPNDWYGFNPSDIVGRSLGLFIGGSNDPALIFRTGAYCMDPHTGYFSNASKFGNYKLRHVVDVNVGDLASNQVRVYGSEGKVTTYDIGKTEAAKGMLEMAYVAEKSYNKKETGVEIGEMGEYKLALQSIMSSNIKSFVNDLGFDSIYTAQSYNIFTAGNVGTYRKEAADYANSIIPNVTLKDVSEAEKQTIRTIDGKTYVGPYKIMISGITIKDINVVTLEGEKVKVSGISSKINGELQDVNSIANNTEFYIVVDKKISNAETVELNTESQKVIQSRMAFLAGADGYGQLHQNLIFFRGETVDKPIILPLPKVEKPKTGDLEIIKKTLGNENSYLEGVGFIVKNVDQDLYVKQDENGEITLVNKKDATEFVTDVRGKIEVKNLEVGKYALIETTVGNNYGYVVSSKEVEVEIEGDINNTFTVYNKQVFIDMSGYVWEDIPEGKTTARNDIYDENDVRVAGITVRLKDSEGNIVKNYDGTLCETKTDENGEYSFKKVGTDGIEKCYVEFTYDGLEYTNVIPKLSEDNGSKAIENNKIRQEFNEKFSVVKGNGDNTGHTENSANTEEYKLEYTKDIENAKSILKDSGNDYSVLATTQDSGYSIGYTAGQANINNINLGIYEREQADLALAQDLLNAKISFNGYTHLYNNYGERVYEGDDSRFNVGVKFKGEYTDTYKRAVYESDVTQNLEDDTKEFTMFVTYEIVLKNETSNLIGVVDGIITHYDPRYKINKIGKEITEQGIITGKELKYNANNGKAIINTNSRMNGIGQEGSNSEKIYIEFMLSKENVEEAINNKELLNCSSEIFQYHTLDSKGNIYASIDKDSNPNNFNPSDSKNTIEDDSDMAPGFLIEYAEARSIEGTVFVDTTSEETNHLGIRQGDGEFKDGEIVVPGVKVTLKNTSIGTEYTETTDENGYFKIEGFVPGDSELVYTWGDDTYNVQEYKATIYNDESRYDNAKWYKNETPRYSDALDNYEIRQNIDKEIQEDKYTITTMDSKSGTMDLGIEYDDIKADKFNVTNIEIAGYNIKNTDFGIVERPRQSIEANKNVKQVNVKLANGQTIVDAEIIEENGERVLQGQTENTAFVPGNESQENGFVKIEMDEEVLQGATIDIVYDISVTNNSELDYIDEAFYNYGTIPTNAEPIKLTPTAVDILDEDLVFNKDINTDWEVVSFEKYNEEYKTKFTLTEQFNSITNKLELDDGTIIQTQSDWYEAIQSAKNLEEIFEEMQKIRKENLVESTILSSDDLSKAIAPGDSNSLELKASKILSNKEEIELDNTVEILEITKDAGSIINPINLKLTDKAETVLVTPPTGDMRDYLSVGLVIISSLVIVIAGVVIIKKKVI